MCYISNVIRFYTQQTREFVCLLIFFSFGWNIFLGKGKAKNRRKGNRANNNKESVPHI